ncbi:MAG: DUF452 family protein [Paramuribaculum sp.]|nr:DUF452 family protein [Paramuribaculum sp.]
MTIQPIHINHEPRLALIFAGWGMDERMFMSLRRGGYDIAVAFNYHTNEDMPQWINGYKEVCIVAWSYGVCMAERVLQQNLLKGVTLKVAVNGTPTPVNDTTGIPSTIYQGTLKGLNERNVYKFYRRMCANAEEFAKWKEHMPQRSLESLTEELSIFNKLECAKTMDWDIVYIAAHDAIIPPENQRRAWQDTRDIRETDSGHLPDFQQLLNEVLIDKSDVEKKFSTHADTYSNNATVQRQMCEHINKLLHQEAPESPASMVEIGAGTGMLTHLYTKWMHPGQLQLWDLCEMNSSLPGKHRKCDAETDITKLSNVNVIASSSTIQWMNNPKLFVTRCANVLSPGGLAIISTFGPNTFEEIGQLIPIPLRYIPVEEWKSLQLPNDCQLSVTEDKNILQFATSRELLRHISLTGVNGCGGDSVTSQRACRAILASNTTSLTYHSIYLTIKKDA